MENDNNIKGNENLLVALKSANEGFEVEYDVLPVIEIDDLPDERCQRIVKGTASIDEKLAVLNDKLDILNKDIDRLTSHADGLDYAVAVTSVVITGIVDATVVREWNFQEAKKVTYKETTNKVTEFAKKQLDYILYCNNALEGKGNPRLKPKDPNRLETAIEFLEWKFHLPGDGAYRNGQFGIGATVYEPCTIT